MAEDVSLHIWKALSSYLFFVSQGGKSELRLHQKGASGIKQLPSLSREFSHGDNPWRQEQANLKTTTTTYTTSQHCKTKKLVHVYIQHLSLLICAETEPVIAYTNAGFMFTAWLYTWKTLIIISHLKRCLILQTNCNCTINCFFGWIVFFFL